MKVSSPLALLVRPRVAVATGDRARRDTGRGQFARRYRGLLRGKAQQLGGMALYRHADMVAKCTTYAQVMHSVVTLREPSRMCALPDLAPS